MGRILKYNEAKFKIIQHLISTGARGGDKLQPEKELSGKIGLGMAPTRHALNELAELGVIRKVNGVGSFLERELGSKERPKCKLGVISVASINEVASRIHDKMKRYEGTYQLFFVSSVPDEKTEKELRSCDRFLLIGYVNDLWINLTRSLGKPVIQLGCGLGKSGIPTVDMDYRSAFRQSIAYLVSKGCTRLGLVSASPEFIAYANTLVEIFLDESRQKCLNVSLRDVYLITQEMQFAKMMEFASTQQGEYDALFVEFSVLWTFALHYWNKPALQTKKVILIENSGKLVQDFENLSSWGVVKFKDNIYEKAVELLYEAPICDLEFHRNWLSAPVFTGPVFKDFININKEK